MPIVQRCLNPIPSIHPYGRSWKSAWRVDPSRKGLITQLSIQASCGSSKLQAKSSFCIQCRSWSPCFCGLTIHSCCWFPVNLQEFRLLKPGPSWGPPGKFASQKVYLKQNQTLLANPHLPTTNYLQLPNILKSRWAVVANPLFAWRLLLFFRIINLHLIEIVENFLFQWEFEY